MKNIILHLAIMMMTATVTFAAGFQGKITKREGTQIVIEVFGEETASFKVGDDVSLEAIPKGVPTLDMLRG